MDDGGDGGDADGEDDSEDDGDNGGDGGRNLACIRMKGCASHHETSNNIRPIGHQ